MQDNLLYYGKLPSFGDFVRYNAYGREIKLFDQWLQEGLYLSKKNLSPNEHKSFKHSPVYYFFLSFKESGNHLTGIMKPSLDKVGRKYPFIVAMVINESGFPQDTLKFLPIQFRNFYHRIYSLIKELVSVTTLDELRRQAIELETPFSMDEVAYQKYHSLVNTTSTMAYFKSLWDNDTEDRKYTFLHNIVRMGKYLREVDPGIIDFGYRFPLQSESYDAFIVGSYWLQLFSRFISGRTVHPFIFWDAKNMFLFFRQPAPVVYSFMMKPDLISDVIYRMDSDGGQEVIDHRHSPQVLNILNTNNITLEQFLETVEKYIDESSDISN